MARLGVTEAMLTELDLVLRNEAGGGIDFEEFEHFMLQRCAGTEGCWSIRSYAMDGGGFNGSTRHNFTLRGCHRDLAKDRVAAEVSPCAGQASVPTRRRHTVTQNPWNSIRVASL